MSKKKKTQTFMESKHRRAQVVHAKGNSEHGQGEADKLAQGGFIEFSTVEVRYATGGNLRFVHIREGEERIADKELCGHLR